ncbi:MAG: polyprenyl synthetase family protein [Candidatus Actinomarinales bacterium]|nr:MAG: polyprenyl synthetase family protein [Candidatus Actinomarinales bacterium]
MESNSLKKIIPIEQLWINLDNFENRLYEISGSKDSYLNDISQYLIKAGGKRFRPVCTLLSGELGNGNNEKIIDAAVAVELIHLGSLYHDDVIDEAETRRSVQSANVKWNSTLSILAGDYLLARSSELAAETLGLESVKLLASTYAELVEGQTKEVQYQYDTEHSTDDYMKVIEGKTASLIRTSAKLGAMAADCDEKTTEAISKWAWHSGLIFQITDDILDLNSNTETLGKEAGKDILEGTYTLPVLLALSKNKEKIKVILEDIKNSKTKLSDVIDEFNNEKIIHESEKYLDYHFKKGLESLDDIQNSKIKNILINISNYLINRSN